MKIGVPGEFHEDRWQRTAEDSERCVLPRTREEGGAHQIQVIACQRVLLTGLRHGSPAHKCSRAIPAWQTGTEPMPNRSMNGAMGPLRHGSPAHRYLRAIPAWQTGTEPMPNRSMNSALGPLRHGTPAHRYLRAISAWLSVLLTGLRHGHPAHKHLGGILAEPL